MVFVWNKVGVVFGFGGEGEKFFFFFGGIDCFVMIEGFIDEVFSCFLGFEIVCVLLFVWNENSII